MRTHNRLLLASLITLSLGIGAAHAQTAVTGLGQSWPNTTDISANSGYHVYKFKKGNITYFQVNDANGTVRGAFMRTVTGDITGLPIGTDASNLATADDRLPAPASTAYTVVYQDAATQIAVAPQSDGSMRMMAVAVECKNPVECTSR
ncbi:MULTISPECIES: hypothetical protein [unclassified Luteibacter]|uniref:hypothetical protein n=1 Tax=unclassified Luteibacter TaxID=2620188 RepID=UPI0008D419F4|nr:MULTISPECIES: hypothetical protein [unclassified Luteibacter]MDR6938069.1 hypothetical protein [Luteibacter sp. 3190]SEW19920.1 hypothetical protein SAMN04515660_2922 [Luteibacter sp. 329MFSha]